MDEVEFRMKVKMQERWIPYFLGMLKIMQKMGSWGMSRKIAFFADGDGNFRPKFEWDTGIQPIEYSDKDIEKDDLVIDAG